MEARIRYDAGAAECLVFTYKEGLLSPVAHDLEIRVGSFEIYIDMHDGAAAGVEATFDAASLRVRCAMRDGREAPGVLSARDAGKIEENLRSDEVLDVRRHPTIRFRSTEIARGAAGPPTRVRGLLHLHGREREVAFPVEERPGPGGRAVAVAEVRLHQPDFGIKPYSAMLGTLKIKPDVLVRLTVPLPATVAAPPPR